MQEQKLEELQREKEDHKLLKTFKGEVALIVGKKSEGVSFQLAYDNVFKLAKAGRENDILALLDSEVQHLLSSALASPHLTLSQLNQELISIREVVQRLSEVCLYLDMNYCQKTLKQSLLTRFHRTIFEAVTSNKNVLEIFTQAAFWVRQQPNQPFEDVFGHIDHVDIKKVFFEKFLIPHYVPLVQQEFSRKAAQTWENSSQIDYIEWCSRTLVQEEAFVCQHLARSQKKEGVEAVVAGIYSKIVTEYKQRLYQAPEKDVFERLTVPLLELFRFGKGKEVEGHIQWFMGALERRLNLIGTEDNRKFIVGFCELYEEVGQLLKGTHTKFEINYRSVFTFEEWINNEKFNIPLRLNLFIDEYFSQSVEDHQFTRQVSLVFRLVKEKKMFQNLYRRSLISRTIRFYLTYRPEIEEPLLGLMQKECGEDWTENIRDIAQLYLKDRASFIAHRSIEEISPGKNLQIGGLVPVVIHEESWPFDDKSSKIELHGRLKEMTSGFEGSYLTRQPKSRLWWTTKVGSVLLEITFASVKRQFLVSVDMANLLLYIEAGPKRLKNFVCSEGYSLDEVEAFLRILVSEKLVCVQAVGEDSEIRLAGQYQGGQLVSLVGEGKKVEVKVMEELKSDRKLMVEAILVKIMKTEKLCKKEQLLERSIPVVGQRGFNFNREFVEKCLDRLIDKEFIRDYEDGTLGYIA